MKIISLLLFLIGISYFIKSQCNNYQIYESFGSTTIPNQGGTWTQNSMISSTNGARTGARSIAFNGSGDWIRTPQFSSPSILSFWYRRSTNTTAWTLIVETSPDNINWTTRSTITNATATYQQHTLNLGALGLTNIFIRLRDARGNGAHERYVEDLAITSTDSLNNSLILFPLNGNCTQTIGMSYTIIDQGGPNETYNNNLDQYMVLLPSDPSKKIELTFISFNVETNYDTLFIYDGPTTSSPLIGSYTGNSNPGTKTSTANGGELTIRFKSDISNIGAWTGFSATAVTVTALPVELLYFEGIVYFSFNNLKWATSSEYNSSHFIVERSIDGIEWKELTNKPAAGNSTHPINYYYLDNIEEFVLHYYRLLQYDIDGKFITYGPIMIDNRQKSKKIIKLVNALGQEVNDHEKGVIFIVYDDGSTKKVIR